MSVRETERKPKSMAHFPDEGYRWLELHENGSVYAHAAIRKRGDVLEGHMTFTRWGARVRRHVGKDMAWFKKEARRLGVKKIMGIRLDGDGEFDPKLFRFARLFGFDEVCTIQTAACSLE